RNTRSKPAGSSPFTSRPATAAPSWSNSSNRRGIASVPSGSNSIAWFGRGRRNSSRSCSGGTTSVICVAVAPSPLDVDIFRPPIFRNSYGTLIGGSRSNTSRAIASERSRDPPAVARSLPHGSIVTPNSDHCAAHSRFHGSLAAPPNGEAQPDDPQPFAHVTRSGRHSKNTFCPSHFETIVVPTRPHVGQMTEIGCHVSGCRTLATRWYTSRTVAARS